MTANWNLGDQSQIMTLLVGPVIGRSVHFADFMGLQSLPSEHDFDPFGGNLDCQHAWKIFGGLTLEQASAKFLDNPLCYQEDFMFMGGKAFAYYFPVIEDYLKSVPEGINDHDHYAWILSHCIKMQFEGIDLPHVRPLIPRVMALASFVKNNIDRFGLDGQERNRVADAWLELVKHLSSIDRKT